MLATAVFTLSFVKAQTADEIIAKNVEAIGGKDKLNSVTSLKMENTMDFMGNEAPSVVTVSIGKGFRSETEFNGQKIIRVLTDKGGWNINPMAGATDPQPSSDDEYKNEKYQLYITPFLDYAANGSKAELVGKEKVGSADAYKINFTTKDDLTTTYYFDPTTYYIVKAVRKGSMMGQDVDITATFSDYKKTDFGVTMPYTMNIDLGQFQFSSKLNKAEFNVPVDPASFEMPK